ncbi:MAG: hypothetical protein GWN00_22900 [Aliifodinibius sp.]|nr:hypothetical protein [Fodinibius sp.]NIY27549.1 hypothetical protein [Fodinibius sp.]
MRMLKSNLLVEKLTKEQLGKIVLPDSVQDDWMRGKVVGVGKDTIEKGEVKEGDIIIFPPAPPHIGDYPTIGSKGYIIIPEEYVWAIED